jgi:hypothetical protein
VDQDQFDENGRLIQRKSKIETSTFDEQTFAKSLKSLQKLFNTDSPSEDIFYLLLSLLQVLPEEEQCKVILDYVRSESVKVSAKIAGKKLTAKQQSDINFALAIFGFNGVIVLLQTHRPQLLPRRSFGSKPLVMRGFPRDTSDISDSPLVDSILGALSQTFESYPTTFRGSSVIFMRNVLNDRKSVKKVVLSSLTKQFVPVFEKQLTKARDSLEKVDVSYSLHNAFEPPIVRPSTTQVNVRFRCLDAGPPWMSPSMPFSFRQEAIDITENLRASRKAKPVVKSTRGPQPYTPSKDEIRAKSKLKAPDFKKVKMVLEREAPEFLRIVILEWMKMAGEVRTISAEIRTYIRDTRPLVERVYLEPSLLRDYLKGILIELSNLFVGNQSLINIIEKNQLTMTSLFSNAVETKRFTDTLRAREREEFKERMRRLPDAQREITKILVDKGISPYLITIDDREMFLKEIQEKEEPPPDRDVGPQGEVPEVAGQELQTDYGDYGDARARNAEGEEFEENIAFGDDSVGF